jgi:hypothetical protein
LALLLVINSYDPEVTPETLVFVDFSGEQVPPEQNVYFDFVGYTAPLGEDPHRMGIKIVDTYNQHVVNGGFADPKTLDIPETVIGPNKLQFHGKALKICDRRIPRCLPVYQKKEREIQEMLARNHVRLERYYRNYRYPHFRETAEDSLLPLLATGDYEASALVRAAIGLQAVHHQTQQALDALRQDTQHWRMVLQDSRTLVSKMVAAARVQRNLQLLSEIIASRSFNGRETQIAREILTPFDESELDMARVFRREFLFTKNFVEKHPAWNDQYPVSAEAIGWAAANRFFWKRNASINLSYEKFRQLVVLARLPPNELLQHFSPDITDMDTSPSIEWDWVYNPIGKWATVEGSVTSYIPYISRLRNQDALMRLVTLQLLAKTHGVRERRMQQFLNQQDQALRNPYTAEPAHWDAQNRCLYFMGMRENGSGELMSSRIEVFLGIVADRPVDVK